MRFTTEQHIVVAKRVRSKAGALDEARRLEAIRISNNLLIAAVLAARDRGTLDLKDIDRSAVDLDWAAIDERVRRLKPLEATTPVPEIERSQAEENRHDQVRQLIKQAMESPTADELVDFLSFTVKFRRLGLFNARMAYIQRPGARAIATEHEWQSVGRHVRSDAVPIIILWPFSPIRYVYELADTDPRIDREKIGDPFAVAGEFKPGMLSRLLSGLKRQKRFRIEVENRRHGFSYAGAASSQGHLPGIQVSPTGDEGLIGAFSRENAHSESGSVIKGIPAFRVTLNDRLEPKERFVTLAHELAHIFCGHLGGCESAARVDKDESGWPNRRNLGVPEREIEAEAAAYLVAARAGLATRSADYLRVHASKADMTRVNIDLVVRAAARIERLGDIGHGGMQFEA